METTGASVWNYNMELLKPMDSGVLRARRKTVCAQSGSQGGCQDESSKTSRRISVESMTHSHGKRRISVEAISNTHAKIPDKVQSQRRKSSVTSFKEVLKAAHFLVNFDRPKRYSRHHMNVFDEEISCNAKFRLVAKMAIFCQRLLKQVLNKCADNDSILPFVNLFSHQAPVPLKRTGLVFDVGYFKANKQLRVGEEARKVLSKSPKDRTSQELYHAELVLKNIKAFAEYPASMQKKVVQVGMYERYEPKRIIVRQGNQPAAFYFILSGTVLVLVIDDELSIARPVTHLHRGQMFGELSIINHSARQSTVVVTETAELLSVSSEDFRHIFMAGGVTSFTDPEYNCFLSALSFLKDWPIDLLVDNPTKCLFNFFKRGELIVKNSRCFHWLIVIKSGSVRVIKKLRKALPLQRRGNGRQTEQSKFGFSNVTWLDNIARTPAENSIHGNRNQFDDVRVPELPGIDHAIEYTSLKDVKHCRMLDLISELKTRRCRRKTLARKRHCGPKRLETSESEANKICEASANKQQPEVNNKRVTFNLSPGELLITGSAGTGSRVPIERNVNFQPNIRTIAKDLASSSNMKNTEEAEGEMQSAFVHIQTLTKGQIFGLSDALHFDQPSLSVISNGAECVLIDKAFYLNHATSDMLYQLRQEVSPYPSEESLQIHLQTNVDWRSYRQRVLNNTVLQRRARKQAHSSPFGA